MRFVLIFTLIFFSCSERTSSENSNKIEFRAIYFEHGSDEINPEYFPLLDSIANFIIKNPDIEYHLMGSCHKSEPDSNNGPNNLAERRSKAIINYLFDHYEIKKTGTSVKVFGPALGSREKYIPPPIKEQRIVKFEIND